jgi:ankyrin repeat protein
VERGGANVNATRTTDSMTALMWASKNGHLEIVRCLVERGGANVNAGRTDNGWTALISASNRGHLEIVRLLQQHGADRHALTHAGETAHALASAHPLVQAALLA